MGLWYYKPLQDCRVKNNRDFLGTAVQCEIFGEECVCECVCPVYLFIYTFQATLGISIHNKFVHYLWRKNIQPTAGIVLVHT